jgi:hypothetical protein
MTKIFAVSVMGLMNVNSVVHDGIGDFETFDC